MVRTAIVGASGYAGRDLATRLARHSRVTDVTLMSGRPGSEPAALDALGRDVMQPFDLAALQSGADVVFSCLPHAVGSTVVRDVLSASAEAVVVDLSADFRFQSAAQYEAIYGVAHPAPELADAARYGLTEHERDALRGARLVANPGCYPTACLLAILPLVRSGCVSPSSRIVIDAKSGVSGAGKKPSEVTLYGNVNETCRAYGVGTHRHAPEIVSRLGADHGVTFVPHLLPMFRGMLATVYLEPASGVDVSAARDALRSTYASEPFVHVVSGQPQTGDVSGTNHCHLGVAGADGLLVVTSAIDNLVKGAAGQAVQNMNVALGFDERRGSHECSAASLDQGRRRHPG